ncbi:STAS domain-containing protein [Kitasatospora sp. NPDC018619]|uniref:STAS domain-containing protein n=1 Tax=unclassified Kitasatospora TaxID=2633591 RepID=UPI0037A5BDA7
MPLRQPAHATPPGATRPLLRITTARTADGAEVVCLGGEADQDQRARLRQAFRRAVDDRPERLVVDLAGLTFCDSACLDELLRCRLATRAVGIALALAAPSARARRLLEITGADRLFEVHGSVRAALLRAG